MIESSRKGLARILWVGLAALQVFLIAKDHTTLLHAFGAAGAVLSLGLALLPQSKTAADERAERGNTK